MSRTEKLLRNILGEENEVIPESRVEKLIANMNGGTYEVTPQSRVEELLQAVNDAGGPGSALVLTTKTVTLNGTYSAEDDSANGYSEVTVNVQGGASMTEVANTYGTEVVITSAPGSAPSATRHTLYFEYEDETNETVYTYYDDALVGPAITATTPTTHNNKTVTLAQLDGTTWYSYTPPTPGPPTPSGNWETVFNGTVASVRNDNGRNVFRSTEMEDIWFVLGETWRVTLNGVAYVCDVESLNGTTPVIGNASLIDEDNGTDEPFIMYNIGSGYMIGVTREEGTLSLKLEEKVE